MEELGICPVCHEDSAFVQCGHCGTHTAFTSYKNEEEKKEAELVVTRLWNMGKVIAESRGE